MSAADGGEGAFERFQKRVKAVEDENDSRAWLAPKLFRSVGLAKWTARELEAARDELRTSPDPASEATTLREELERVTKERDEAAGHLREAVKRIEDHDHQEQFVADLAAGHHDAETRAEAAEKRAKEAEAAEGRREDELLAMTDRCIIAERRAETLQEGTQRKAKGKP